MGCNSSANVQKDLQPVEPHLSLPHRGLDSAEVEVEIDQDEQDRAVEPKTQETDKAAQIKAAQTRSGAVINVNETVPDELAEGERSFHSLSNSDSLREQPAPANARVHRQYNQHLQGFLENLAENPNKMKQQVALSRKLDKAKARQSSERIESMIVTPAMPMPMPGQDRSDVSLSDDSLSQ
eukprot:TRINITY_DN78011_c0_g1_i1.p1 TRINITY_DN78011_c0_g1~~TRINITY_DN78011_c0_g1_i1.p1  ORF type:complete len:181 (+),score=24.49 TRINITY_DN78011_c0_g1_i1:35-577(+)